MTTVSRVQKATVLAAADTVHLSSDGTTLHQIKKAGSMNSVALRIHDVPNGSAQSALDDLEEEIDQLVIIAEKFGCSPDDITLAKVYYLQHQMALQHSLG